MTTNEKFSTGNLHKELADPVEITSHKVLVCFKFAEPVRSRSTERYTDPVREQHINPYQSKTLQRDPRHRNKLSHSVEPTLRPESYQPYESSQQPVVHKGDHDYTIIHKPVPSRPTIAPPSSNTYENVSQIQSHYGPRFTSVSNPDYIRPSHISKSPALTALHGMEDNSSQSEQDNALAHSSPKQENDGVTSQRKDVHRAKIVNFVEPPKVQVIDYYPSLGTTQLFQDFIHHDQWFVF